LQILKYSVFFFVRFFLNLFSSCLSLPSAGITRMPHPAQLKEGFEVCNSFGKPFTVSFLGDSSFCSSVSLSLTSSSFMHY
jgi:hypothetical protein